MSKKSSAVDEKALHLAQEAVISADDCAPELDKLSKYLKLLLRSGFKDTDAECDAVKKLIQEQIVWMNEAAKLLADKTKSDLRLEYLGTANNPGKGVEALAADLRTRAAKMAGDSIMNTAAKAAGAAAQIKTLGGVVWGS